MADITCPHCKKHREVKRAMCRLIERGVHTGQCLSCSSKGNKRSYKEIYEKKYYMSPIYKVWQNMKTRCTNKKVIGFKDWGGRGITYCKEWANFKGFLDDMLATYKKGLTIDRIDNHKGYSKENCRWATPKEQANNTRNIERVKKYSLNGIEYTIRQLAEKFNIKRTTLDMRLNLYDWSLQKSITS